MFEILAGTLPAAIILSAIMFLVLAIGFVFSFVPIQFSKGKFVSITGTINISSDMVGGMYGEYNITTEDPTQGDIIQTISLIRETFEDEGYKNVNVYAVCDLDELKACEKAEKYNTKMMSFDVGVAVAVSAVSGFAASYLL